MPGILRETHYLCIAPLIKNPEAEFKEFEPRLKWLRFHLKLYSIFKLRRLFKTGFWQI